MARIDEIKKQITDNFTSNDVVVSAYGLDPERTFDEQFSRASLESILFYNDAYRVLQIEELFKHNLDLIDEKIRNQRPHTLGWYRQMALNFQFGKEFRDDITEYDNSGMTADEIEAQRIIRKCSVTRAETVKPTLIMKVHKADGKLEADEKTAFIAYMDAVADAGVHVSVISENADRLVLYLTIRYDAMVMDEHGVRFLDSVSPVPDTIVAHLANLPFNGEFFPTMLEQDLMRQTGIRLASVRLAKAGVYGAEPTEIVDAYTPYSGAIVIDTETDLHVRYERI
jgi:hypothetical protein